MRPVLFISALALCVPILMPWVSSVFRQRTKLDQIPLTFEVVVKRFSPLRSDSTKLNPIRFIFGFRRSNKRDPVTLTSGLLSCSLATVYIMITEVNGSSVMS